MSEPHLILHKVRGLPAFDIAEQIEVVVDGETETWWIIPTSGHRAYPWWTSQIATETFVEEGCITLSDSCIHIPDMPQNWPDHYPYNSAPKPPSFSPATLLFKLGLTKPINRRF